MDLFVAVTDGDWHELLSSTPGLDEANFWQPGGNTVFRALQPGGLFLFKLHAPRNVIVGGGFFAHASLYPVSLAWDAFGEKNGATTLEEMRRRIEKYRKQKPQPHDDYKIGCIILEEPFFFDREDWIPQPADWHPNIVQGKGYDTSDVVGRRLWDDVQQRLARRTARMTGTAAAPAASIAEPAARFGKPTIMTPRLGQGSFRVIVTDAFERRCAVTKERTLPALEAAHIRPYGQGGEHRVDNGLLLRRDLHALFDRGYVTVTPEYKFEVSRRLKEDFENGRDYYALQGRELWLPMALAERPNSQYLHWHNRERYLG
ncbi:MAG TPA: HNH endonuclease [Candidatus Polarisedimenticolaceae bacterium]|nr:HNH endonuclease [Candidatus Polarisedimenticolaceae bacterium]